MSDLASSETLTGAQNTLMDLIVSYANEVIWLSMYGSGNSAEIRRLTICDYAMEDAKALHRERAYERLEACTRGPRCAP